MRLILQYYSGFLQKKTEKIDVDPEQTSDQVLEMISKRVGKPILDLIVKIKKDQHIVLLIHGWPISFYELQNNQIISVEIRETEAQLSQKEQKRLVQRYYDKLGVQLGAKLSQVSETSEHSSDEEKKQETKQEKKIDIEQFIFQYIKQDKLSELKNLQVKPEQLNTATLGGWNPIHFAVFLERLQTVEYLISQNVDINKVTEDGNTPLLISIHRQSNNMLEFLLQQSNIDVNQVTEKGTALILAAKTNQLHMIRLLLYKQADINIKDKSDKTFLDYATDEIKNLLATYNTNSQYPQAGGVDEFMPPRPPITSGYIYKTGQMLVTLNLRYFVLNPDEGVFIRYKELKDYPLKPLEIILLKNVKSVMMAPKSLLTRQGYFYFELMHTQRMLLACKHEHIAQQWVSQLFQAAVYYQKLDEKIKANEINVEFIPKNTEVFINDEDNQQIPIKAVVEKQFVPDQPLHMPKDQESYRQSDISQSRSSINVEENKSPNESVDILVRECKVQFSSFEVIKELGSGAFGKVLLVKKKDDQQKYAMKALKKRNLILKKQLKYAVSEANILKNCHHPFILGLHFAFQTPNHLYLILDYCSGGDLSLYISAKGTFTEQEARFYIAELVLAIEYLHTQDIVYRDMKPENILISEKGHIKLADFGLSKEGVGDKDTTTSFCGSPAYISPEMLSKTGTGKASDIYGIGTVLFEMLNGEPPFYNDDIPTMYKNIQSGNLKWINKQISPEAKDLITQMLDKNPTKRIGFKSKDEIKRHKFFQSIDWDKVYNCKYEPPITDFSNYIDQDDYDEYDVGGGNRAVFNDQDYGEENSRVNRVVKFSFVQDQVVQ